MERVVMLVPIVTAAAGYFLDGVSGAESGLLIPLGPALLAWLFGGP